MNVLMGIGNEMKGDDGIGNVIAREFNIPGWKSIPCETVPENFTSVIKRENPEILVIVDATEMGLGPGEFRQIPKEKLNSDIVGTHGIPLMHLVSYLEEYARKIIFIGVQPKKMDMGGDISQEVGTCKNKLIDILEKRAFDTIRSL